MLSAHDSSPIVLPLHYENHLIRVLIDEQHEWWWVARDLADVLGLSNIRMNMKVIPEHHKGVHIIYTPGGAQEMAIVDEIGYYRLAFMSRKPDAITFQEWVFSLLKTMRKRGMFSLAGMPTPEAQAGMAQTELLPQGHARIIEKHSHAGPSSKQEDYHFEITEGMVAVWNTLQASTDWLSRREICERAKTNTESTGRYLRRLTMKGLLDVARAKAFYYRVSESAAYRHPEFYREMKRMQGIYARERNLLGSDYPWRVDDFN